MRMDRINSSVEHRPSSTGPFLGKDQMLGHWRMICAHGRCELSDHEPHILEHLHYMEKSDHASTRIG